MVIALFGRGVGLVDADKLSILLNRLDSCGITLCYHKFLYERMNAFLYKIPAGTIFSSVDDLPNETDLMLSLGGDGTFLRSITLLKGRQIPVAGINFGRLGFLTTAKVGMGSNNWIDDIISGRYSIEKRMILEVDSETLPKNFYPYSLNEVSIIRRKNGIMGLDVMLDGRKLPTYWADGLVVSTPTGSTAYSLSVGGPVVTPDCDVLILAPVAPHNLNVRPIVLSSNTTIEIEIHSNAVISLDNRFFDADSGVKIVVKKADYQVNYVSLFDTNFVDALRDKLLWGGDVRNEIKNEG